MRVPSTDSLRSHLRWLGRVVGSEAVSLYVPPEAASQAGLLVHGKIKAAVPELKNAHTALACTERLERLARRSGVWSSESALRLLSSQPRSLLIRLPAPWPLGGSSSTEETPPLRRRRTDLGPKDPSNSPPSVFLGLLLTEGNALLDTCSEEIPVELEAEDASGSLTARTCLLALLSEVATLTRQASAALDDPVSGLPGRAGLLADLDVAVNKARSSGKSMTLLLVNPDHFQAINDRFGREAGDAAMREVATRLKSSLRHSDRAAKYGGASFAAVLEETSFEEGQLVAAKMLRDLGEAAFLSGAARLGFSVGIAVFDPGGTGVEGVLDLIRRADQALFAAKRSGGGQAVCWQEKWRSEEVGNQDRLTGIFTGKSSKDYRNMALLMDAIGVIAATSEFPELARQVVESLFVRLRPKRIAIFGNSDGSPEFLTGLPGHRGDRKRSGLREFPELGDSERSLVEESFRLRLPIRRNLDSAATRPGGQELRCVIPLVLGEDCLGCLYLEGSADGLEIDHADLIFLKALASQLAVAADRAQLAEQERRRQEEERERLEQELVDLRRALQEAKLVYRSPQMEELLSVARRVAPTEATVLILGESGTGKELLARTVHEISSRRKKPLLVVDCASIPSNLIESELFGHERGAFTGADRRKIGRLAEADGSTVVLDEIGELPLEVQSRFLRFVQEKQLTPVGGSRSRSVDIRVIASTHRDLAEEVAAGRFREDLYHRLNVVRLVVPPLRRRPEDILYLAEHYREIYSLLYRKSTRFSPEAEATLLRHPWPGNVRELQNCIMQGVILSEGGDLGVADLGLQPVSGSPPEASHGAEPSATSFPFVSEGVLASADRRDREEAEDPWVALRTALDRQIREICHAERPQELPLGKWLADDLVLSAAELTRGVARPAARLLDMPVTTFRRRWIRARSLDESGLASRLPSWFPVQRAVARLIVQGEGGGEPLLQQAETVLLEEIEANAPDRIALRAALMGVTEPTYRRRVRGHATFSLEEAILNFGTGLVKNGSLLRNIGPGGLAGVLVTSS